jgi:hypothetical protein
MLSQKDWAQLRDRDDDKTISMNSGDSCCKVEMIMMHEKCGDGDKDEF